MSENLPHRISRRRLIALLGIVAIATGIGLALEAAWAGFLIGLGAALLLAARKGKVRPEPRGSLE